MTGWSALETLINGPAFTFSSRLYTEAATGSVLEKGF